MDVNENKIDLMSISGHKLYGPKGIGAIYVRRRPRVRLEAQISGGGQVRPPLPRKNHAALRFLHQIVPFGCLGKLHVECD